MNLTQPDITAFSGQRQKMVDDYLVKKGIRDSRVLQAMREIPRHLFVSRSLSHQVYGDTPLPIGEGQTLSQPLLQAVMTEVLQLKGGERVLEIGTGSGYQTALLAELACQVFTVERILSLSQLAKKRLLALGYSNINFMAFDGTYGWREQSPYDAVLIAAATPTVPESLIEQMSPGGRMILPLGNRDKQRLTVVNKGRDGSTSIVDLGDCQFVPLIGKYGVPLPVEGR